MNYEDEYYLLEIKYKRLFDSHMELKEKYNELNNQLYSAEFKIRTELEPRIKSEEKAYDIGLSDGGYSKWMSDQIDEFIYLLENVDYVLDCDIIKKWGKFIDKAEEKGVKPEEIII